MKKSEKGFTLLEAIFAILLFAFLTQMLMSFFVILYKNGKFFQKQSNLMDNARVVNAFVKEKIREADCVKITLTDGTVIEPNDEFMAMASSSPSPSATPIVLASGKLKEIEFQKQDKADPTKMIKSCIKLEGNYTLNYYGDGTSTPNPISKVVKDITVIENNFENVTFNCIYSPLNPQDEQRETVKDNFSESLAYKCKVK